MNFVLISRTAVAVGRDLIGATYLFCFRFLDATPRGSLNPHLLGRSTALDVVAAAHLRPRGNFLPRPADGPDMEGVNAPP